MKMNALDKAQNSEADGVVESAAQCGLVFEAVDATSDEQYWTLGIWMTLEAALAELEGCQEPSDFGCYDHDDYDEVCVVEIRERKIGWSGVGKKLATLTWRRKYDEASDEFRWYRDETANPSDARKLLTTKGPVR